MYSGIVPMTAKVVAVNNMPGQKQFKIDLQHLAHDVKINDSVAINGACLTVVALTGNIVTFTAVPQTLAITNLTHLQQGYQVNIELSLRYGDVVGGHLVQGHVDTTTKIVNIKDVGDAWQVTFALPETLCNYVIPKGYIAIDGMSLTVNALAADTFSVALIPHTRAVTIAKHYSVGTQVNIEVDMLAKYVENNWRNTNAQHY